MNGMTCEDAYNHLRTIYVEKFPTVEWASVSYLENNELVETMTRDNYDTTLREMREIGVLQKDKAELFEEMMPLIREIRTLEKKHASSVYRGWHRRSNASKNKLKHEKEKLGFHRITHDNISNRVANFGEQILQLELRKTQVIPFKDVGGIYAHLTAQGIYHMELMGKYLDKGLKAWEYERFKTTLNKPEGENRLELLLTA